MINPQDLQVAKRKREREENRLKAEQERKHKEWLKRYNAECLARVPDILEGLGRLILQADEKGYRQLEIRECRVYYYREKYQDWNEWYHCPFKLGFEPAPTEKYTKKMLAGLKEAGYEVEIVTEDVEDLEWSHANDGCFVGRGTYHKENYLHISWRG